MTTGPAIVENYLKVMGVADGAAVRAMFVPDGVIDDYRGGRRVGGETIERLQNARSRRTIDLVSDVIVDGDRQMVFAEMEFADGRAFTVRFIFTIRDGMIEHLVNSVVEFVPEHTCAARAAGYCPADRQEAGQSCGPMRDAPLTDRTDSAITVKQ